MLENKTWNKPLFFHKCQGIGNNGITGRNYPFDNPHHHHHHHHRNQNNNSTIESSISNGLAITTTSSAAAAAAEAASSTSSIIGQSLQQQTAVHQLLNQSLQQQSHQQPEHCLETLLRNIEGLLAIAAHNARQQQAQLQLQKG